MPTNFTSKVQTIAVSRNWRHTPLSLQVDMDQSGAFSSGW